MNQTHAHTPAGTLYVVAAPSGAGKTSLLDALLARRASAVLSVSCTTRAPRPGERNGKHYRFVDAETFRSMIDADAFLEHAEVFGNRYGTPRAPVEERLAQGLDVVLEIDWQGARQVRRRLPEAVGIFILPPSRETLIERLHGRGQDSDAVIARRTAEAEEELSHFAEFDFLIVNDDFANAVADLEAVFRSRRLRGTAQTAALAPLLRTLVPGQ